VTERKVKLDQTDYDWAAEQLDLMDMEPSDEREAETEKRREEIKRKKETEKAREEVWMSLLIWTFTVSFFLGSVSLGLGALSENVSLIYLGFFGLGLTLVLLVIQWALSRLQRS
jgi:hypothetical protein